jgi:predicted transcriptional regulator
MKANQSSSPTPSELAILQILWKDGPSSVRHIHEKLSEEKEVVYTTILKTMQVMSERGMLRRTAKGRKHIYQAAVDQDDTQDELLDRFLDKTFGGSASKLVLKALGNYNASKEELDLIKQFIEKKNNKK